jgi:hypothetical protein
MVYFQRMKHKMPIPVLVILGISIFVFLVLHVMGYFWLKYR